MMKDVITPPHTQHLYPYRWSLEDAVFTKDKGKVFSCFACGGGSTMGYKIAGYDVIGCNEIDPRMMKCYETNHHPQYSYLEDIRDLVKRNNLPEELYHLDILDGSPPCSTFSMSGLREDAWGKEKKFKEGQKTQVLDTLFFDFIALAKRLKPKVVIAENVKGLLLGNAMIMSDVYTKTLRKLVIIVSIFFLMLLKWEYLKKENVYSLYVSGMIWESIS